MNLFTVDYIPAWMILAEAKVGANAQNPGKILYSLIIHTEIKMVKIPTTPKIFEIFLFWILYPRYATKPPTAICQNLQIGK